MILSVFSTLYEWSVGKNNDPIYADEVFYAVGIFSLVIALGCSLLFYLGAGRWKPLFHQLTHWLIVLLVVALLAGLLALQQSKSATQSTVTDAYMVRFALFNSLFSVACFALFSLLLKRFSIFAKHTPF